MGRRQRGEDVHGALGIIDLIDVDVGEYRGSISMNFNPHTVYVANIFSSSHFGQG